MGAVSTTPYTSQSISGYNSSPPTDDGAQTAANQVAWSKHKTKIGDPIKTLTESVNSALVTAFAKSVNTDAGERNQFSGSLALDWATATITTDSITPTWSAALVGSESGATSDTLQVISATGVYQGALLTIKQRHATEEIRIIHATSTAATATGANIYLPDAANITLNDVNRTLQFSYDSGFASGWVPVAEGQSNFFVGSFTRDTSVATGSQSVTGVGFKPKSLLFLANITATSAMSIGLWGKNNTAGCLLDNGAGAADSYTTNSSSVIFMRRTATADATAEPGTFDADGFTISWTKTGSPTGTTVVIYLAMR